jgi:uncharacterized protein
MSISKNGIHVFGEGTISVNADTLKLTLGVITDGLELQTAQVENSEAISNVIQAIIKNGIIREDFKTVDYRIEPQYRYEEGKQLFSGYRVTHMLEIKTNQIDAAGRIVDSAVRSGANSVSSIQFTIENSAVYYQHALKLASHDALQKAETLARAFGTSIIRIPYLIEEEQHTSGPIPLAYTALKAEAQTQIEPGKLTIQARIKAYFHLI